MTRLRHPLGRAAVGVAALAMVVAAACGSGGSAAKPKGNAVVSIKGFKFLPERIVLPAGSDLRVTNEDKAAHTLTADDKSFDTGNIAAGKEAHVKVSNEGLFAYHCAIHDSMRGVIQVRS
ncbi:MAG TPA: cupredoxin domain-containing protein [Acidimicrobiales bacterium]|nr:cupredoxin domain-containing protein [Acidimicrobiales bacterium]